MIIIRIPAPCEFINANVSLHRMAKAKLTKTWRQAAWVACRNIGPLNPPVRIIAHIHKPRSGRWDPNNYAPTTKACIDGLVDAGLLPDDSWREVTGPDHRRGETGPAAITLTITQEPRPTKEG